MASLLFAACRPASNESPPVPAAKSQSPSVNPSAAPSKPPAEAPALAQVKVPAPTSADPNKIETEFDRPRPILPAKLPPPERAVRLSEEDEAWADSQEGVVIVDGQLCLRQGMLELFACRRNSKEHESVISADARAYVVHAALMALGAAPGSPAQFQPEYKPPSGTELDIFVEWYDEEGNLETTRAQEWILDVRTGKAMTYPFVFAGSLFLRDPETGKQHYMADQNGEFICVSNFGTSMIDIPVESSQANADLWFAPFTERLPQLGAPVRLIIKPKLEKSAVGDSAGKGDIGTVDDDN